jgi:hypothetical protein
MNKRRREQFTYDDIEEVVAFTVERVSLAKLSKEQSSNRLMFNDK